MKQTVKEGKVWSKNGLPMDSLYFCDGRTVVSFDKQGIKELRYFMPFHKSPNTLLFRRNIFDCFRCFIEKNGRRYTPVFSNVFVYPFGIFSDWVIDGKIFKLSVYIADEIVFFTLDGDPSYEFAVSFYEQTQMNTYPNADFESFDYGLKRRWSKWQIKENCLETSLTESDESEAFSLKIKIVGDNVDRITKAEVNSRFTIYTKNIGRMIAIVFGNSDEDINTKSEKIKTDHRGILARQIERYEKLINTIPRLLIKNSGIGKFVSLAPLYHESLKPLDVKGCVRAQTARYWVWGWDSIISNESTLTYGDIRYVKDMLEYYEMTADKQKGLVHGISFDNTWGSATEVAAQGIYISLAETYFNFTGDVQTIIRHYPFILKLFRLMLSRESKIGGLIESSSLFPDYVRYLKETGKDISLFNNSMAYSAARAMETLALIADDAATAQTAREFFLKTEKNFLKTFWNGEKGYFVSSVDSETFEQREVYSPCGYFWDGSYHEELIGYFLSSCYGFIKNKAIGKAGFRSLPVDYEFYDAEANQLHCCWPAVEEIIVKILKKYGDTNELKHWANRIVYWTNRLTCPEGISSQFETDEPEFDRWNCEPGIWQAYSLRKWYVEIFSVICGISMDIGGITFDDPIENYELKNLVFHGKKLSVKCIGAGRTVEYIEINGRRLYGTKKIPYDLLVESRGDDEDKLIKIIVKRCDYEFKGLAYSYGIKLTSFKKDRNKLQFSAESIGTKEFHFENVYDIKIDGKKIISEHGAVKFFFEKNKRYSIECKVRYSDEKTAGELADYGACIPCGEVYKNGDLKLYIFKPNGKIRGGIMCIHGGGWSSDSAKRFFPHCAYFAQNGLLAVSVEYGLIGQKNKDVRELIADCADALDYLRKHYPDVAFYILGESAGGYMATCLGNKKILSEIRPGIRIADGIIDLDGIVDLKGKWKYGISENKKTKKQLREICRDFSPTDNVSDEDSPVYIMHGDADSIVSIKDSIRYASKLKKAGVRTKINKIKGIEHAFILFDYGYDNAFVLDLLKDLTEQVIDFFNL